MLATKVDRKMKEHKNGREAGPPAPLFTTLLHVNSSLRIAWRNRLMYPFDLIHIVIYEFLEKVGLLS